MIKTPSEWWKLDYSEWEDIDFQTDPSVVIEVLKQCCHALNHEDENYIPAIKFAIRYIERGEEISKRCRISNSTLT